MKFIYPAVIRKNNEGKYDAFFPDLECCYAQGDTLEEAVDNANEAAYNWLYVEVIEDDGQLPPVSDPGDLSSGGRCGEKYCSQHTFYRWLGRIDKGWERDR